MAHSAEHAEHAEHTDHIVPVSVYLKVFTALMLFLFATVAAAFMDLNHIFPGLNIIVALAIAVIKATLVVLYFMHVKDGTRLTWLWAGVGFVWFLLLFLTLSDYLTRNWGAIGW